jgi:hypothetical protein
VSIRLTASLPFPHTHPSTHTKPQFFQQDDNVLNDGVMLIAVLAVFYALSRAFGELAKL